ncbi:MAG: 4Fe-4S binding protein [Opitutaceae bacterium]|nr:4Fe-4S binding protein [Opitutaceae bacterium]
MKITTARRLAQIFFFVLFVWLCLVATVGTGWSQWRGWPINWFLELDPLVALGTVLTTHSLHPGLWWGLATVVVTILLGRVFCGFLCPFGAIHQFIGWLGRRGGRFRDHMAANAYRPAQVIKYYILIALLSAAAGNLLFFLVRASRDSPAVAMAVIAAAVLALFWLTLRKVIADFRRALLIGAGLLAAWVGLAAILPPDQAIIATLQTGLLDPIPLVYRSFNLAVLPIAGLAFEQWLPGSRLYAGAGLIGAVFVVFVLLNLVVPRFFCRFICPTGALLGVLGRGTLWTIGKTGAKCSGCSFCDVDCEGACNPIGPIRVSECLMCMNCLDNCPTAQPLGYLPRPARGGEIVGHGITRRGFVASVAAGFAAVPLARLGAATGANWSPRLIRPPGSVTEEEFLARCLKCDECIRVCPTNVLQPAGFAHGWEALWTPVLNNRIGTSGCQLNCIACGHACPSGAIRPLTLDERHGKGDFAAAGPLRIGLAFVDRGRCLPWAMERPCIVCEENCPVTPKAIYVDVIEQTVRDGAARVASVEGPTLRLTGPALTPGRFATGDFSCRITGEKRGRKIIANTADSVTVDAAQTWAEPPAAGAVVEVQVRLQRPVVDPARCIGCGICEHECPVSGQRAIRVTADNETRSPGHVLLLKANV